jgi:hypothetical protein
VVKIVLIFETRRPSLNCDSLSFALHLPPPNTLLPEGSCLSSEVNYLLLEENPDKNRRATFKKKQKTYLPEFGIRNIARYSFFIATRERNFYTQYQFGSCIASHIGDPHTIANLKNLPFPKFLNVLLIFLSFVGGKKVSTRYGPVRFVEKKF